ncbi:MAG: carboxylating nicotinate-nucleotide diphosphorylase [Promethearchaeota archaeon]|nr:MAG: carboxylating nicotinate-nucleotide diphosphorylase [Candidatus Lokiarchaeota archaeon]
MRINKIFIEHKLKEFLREDCSFKDVSSEFIPPKSSTSAKIIAKSDGYISGLEVIKILFQLLDVSIKLLKKDGDPIHPGDTVIELKGNTRDILLGERVGLNLLTLMSSITTTTKKFTKIIEKSQKQVKIACTRKTTPGLRIFEKLAVQIGGGDTHRYSLDDMILLKDTHLKFYNGDIKKLLSEVRKNASFSKKIELEIENVKDIVSAVNNGVDIIMLDNMSPAEARDAVNLLREKDLRDKVKIEISGGITIDNIKTYLDAEPDIISTSELTLIPSEKVDLSLRFE